jgi:hypothetical protein
MNSKWRPAMGWMYMLVCVTDFVLFPILWSMVQVIGDGKVESQWVPITLQGAGLFHIAMGAILGIAAYGRTQEKMSGTNHSGMQLPTTSTPSSFGAAPSFGGAPLGGNTMSTAPSFSPASTFGGGRPRGPAMAEQPEL